MAYLIWGLLNICIFIFFIAICFKATKLLREKSGLFASVVFAFGLLSFIIHPNNHNREPNLSQVKTWTFASEDSLVGDQALLIIELEKTLISTYDLSVKYGKDKNRNLNTPISAYSSTTGFISGTNWIPVSILVNKTANNEKFEYTVYGIVEWKLLDATIYSQSKDYKGYVTTK